MCERACECVCEQACVCVSEQACVNYIYICNGCSYASKGCV